MSLKKVALITGAADGIGKATAETLSRRDFSLALLDRDESKLWLVGRHIQETGVDCLPIQVDITDPAQIDAGVAQVLEHFGRIDVLANVAGVIVLRTLLQTTLEQFDWVIDVNLRGTFLMMKAVLPQMIQQGSGNIVNISSVSGHEGYTHHAVYSASKAGVLRLTEAAADELRENNIRVNAICPSGVATDLFGKELRKLDRSKWLQPQDNANVIAYLVSDEAGGITGAAVDVKGMYVVSVDEVRPYLDLGDEQKKD